MNKKRKTTSTTKENASVRTGRIVDLAKMQHHRDGECEIDDTAVVSAGDDNGAYVQAWVWVDFNGSDLDKETRRRRRLPGLDARRSAAVSQDMPIEDRKSTGLCAWNHNGSARKDTGKERDGNKPSGFDEQYPIDENHPCKGVSDAATVGELLARLRDQLSYPVRYEIRPEDAGRPINLRGVAKTAEKLLIHAARTLGSPWQLMRFNSRFTLYQQPQPKHYAFGAQLYP